MFVCDKQNVQDVGSLSSMTATITDGNPKHDGGYDYYYDTIPSI